MKETSRDCCTPHLPVFRFLLLEPSFVGFAFLICDDSLVFLDFPFEADDFLLGETTSIGVETVGAVAAVVALVAASAFLT